MKKLIILEGPDGGGKTTLGASLAEHFICKKHTHLTVINHGPYKGEPTIWKHYFESMLPAYSDSSHVLLDRCWLAEPVYGRVYRDGLNRLEAWQTRILEHIAASCSTTVIYCLPGVERCVAAFKKRREVEMLDNEQQLHDVYHLYLDQAGDINGGPRRFAKPFIYNYAVHTLEDVLDAIT